MESKRVFDLRRSILVHGINIQNSAIKFIELDASEKPIKIVRANNQRHASGYCLILD